MVSQRSHVVGKNHFRFRLQQQRHSSSAYAPGQKPKPLKRDSDALSKAFVSGNEPTKENVLSSPPVSPAQQSASTHEAPAHSVATGRSVVAHVPENEVHVCGADKRWYHSGRHSRGKKGGSRGAGKIKRKFNTNHDEHQHGQYSLEWWTSDKRK